MDVGRLPWEEHSPIKNDMLHSFECRRKRHLEDTVRGGLTKDEEKHWM